jgi:hypothetical protein
MTGVLELAAAWVVASVALCLVLASAIGRAERRSAVEHPRGVPALVTVPALVAAEPLPAPAAIHRPTPPQARPAGESAPVSATWVTTSRRPPAPRPASDADAQNVS